MPANSDTGPGSAGGAASSKIARNAGKCSIPSLYRVDFTSVERTVAGANLALRNLAIRTEIRWVTPVVGSRTSVHGPPGLTWRHGRTSRLGKGSPGRVSVDAGCPQTSAA